MILRGKLPETQSTVNVLVENGKIRWIEPYQKGSSCDVGGADLYLCSGFFDLQVNGFAGVDFNSPHLTPEGLHQAARSLASTGVTRFFPTLITSSHERIVHQLKIIADILRNDPLLQKMCLGIHLEGPYISPGDGPRGVHPRQFVRLPEWEELVRFQEACEGRIKCLTMAPELNGAIPFIERAVARGIVIGIGHTRASERIIEEAVQAGARFSCHLGNAPSAISSRYQNLIQKQLTMGPLMASVIVDGIHLPPNVVKHYVETKGIDHVLLITDSMAGAGAPPGRYTLGEIEVDVGPDQATRLVGNSRLAGSALTMDRAVTNVIRFAEVDLASAVQMAAKNAQKLFSGSEGKILPGESADLVLFEYQNELIIKSTWIAGEEIS